MKENNISNESKNVKRGFYARVAENEQNDRKKTVILSVILGVLAVILLLVAAETANSLGKYVYVYGERQQKIDYAQAVQNGVQFIDMNALSEFAGIEKTASGSSVTYKINGTYANCETGYFTYKGN